MRRGALTRIVLLSLGALLLACALVACGGASGRSAPLRLPRSAATLPRSGRSHFVLIMLENRELREVLGDASAPYIQKLAREGTLATDYHAITHPSLPNYIALLAGSPLGISSDCSSCVAHGSSLIDELEAAHVSWRAYMQGLPKPCYKGAGSGEYAKKHDPFLYFPQIARSRSRCGHVVPLTDLAADLRSAKLPDFAWISPDLCDDGHDCGNAAPNSFLSQTVPYLLSALGPHGVLAIVWDEGTSDSGCCGVASGGRVPLILLGPAVRSRYELSTAADHYSLLAAIEVAFGVRKLRESGCPCTPSLGAAFKGGRPPRLGGG